MAIPNYDPNQVHQPAIPKARFKHPDIGYLEYEVGTMRIRSGQTRISNPISLAGVKDSDGRSFAGTNQPYVPTCSEPVKGVNWGCPKWAGCPFKALPYVGPVQLRVRYDEAVSPAMCHDYYETLDERGMPISQNHMGMDGWKIDTSDTTHPVVGYNVLRDEEGKIVRNEMNGKPVTVPGVWHREIPNLAPPWWPLIAKKLKDYAARGEKPPKNLALPRGAELYPELVGVDECGDTESSAASQPSASRNGRGKRIGSASRKKSGGTASTNASSAAGPSS